MSEMIERVARAICKRGVEGANPSINWSRDAFKSYVDIHWPEYVDFAILAIEAMLTPTDEMLQCNAGSFDDSIERFKIYQDMIKKALK